MGIWNLADILGMVFLGYGILDGYRKGIVKKGIALAASAGTLLVVYMASPYVAEFIAGILPGALSLEQITGTDSQIYQILVLSGFGETAESYVYTFVSRVLAVAVTFAVVRILLATLSMSLHILVKVPGLSLLNRLLGAALGLVQQLLLMWMFFLVVSVFAHADWGGALALALQESAWVGYLYENNLLLLLGILLILDV
ncbi:MAG: CvpA family protein [Lachnospiraceae bacterium]|nr:CvpA family protein [Lachnospiraceae bacterium]